MILPDDDTLVLHLYQHVPVHLVSQSVDVGRVLIGRLQHAQKSTMPYALCTEF